MLTPQEIDGITLDTALFGGYDTKSVDAFLEPLIEDYSTLYKENALLKSKMRILVGKLEEYRANESSMKDAMVNAQKTCDKMVREAEEKCAHIRSGGSEKADEETKAAAAEAARIARINQQSLEQLAQVQEQLNSCVQVLEQVKSSSFGGTTPFGTGNDVADDVAAEIAANLRNLMGTTDEPTSRVKQKRSDLDTTGKFADLQFGRNYDPVKR